ncbi:MAG: TolC family protein [Thiotrichales bacterium]|nr:TolC family protein [Thiotrichales bacterium]
MVRFKTTQRSLIMALGFGLSALSLPLYSIAADQASNDVGEQASLQNTEKVDVVTLPNPLTLDYVLSLPLNQLPQMQYQQAQLNQLQAQKSLQTSTDKTQLNLVGRLGWREFADETQDYNLAAVHLNQKLYDFNQSERLLDALDIKQQAQQMAALNTEKQIKLQVMQAYFNVLLADFQYRIDNEAMAIAYVGLDKAKDRLDLKRMSDVDYLEIETDYEKVLVKRTRSEYRQLQTRLALANLLGLPKARPDELTLPKLASFSKRDVQTLDLEKLQQQVIDSNPEIQVLKQQIQAGLLEMESKQAQGKPTISLDAWAGQLSSYPDIREGRWQIGLLVDMPLYDGGAIDAKVNQVKARNQQLDAQMRLKEQALRDEVSDLYFQLKLLKSEKSQNQKFGDYSDLYLDYSRALYENESATDLGDAMVRLSQANYNQISWQFKQALLWSKLDLLMAKPILTAEADQQTETVK